MSESRPNESRRGKVRASDAEREAVAGRVRAAVEEGRLDLSELDERLTEVYAAKYQHELVEVTADLPVDKPSEKRVSGPTADRLRELRPLRVHAVVVVVLSTFMIVRWVALGTPYFWPIFPIFWLGMSLFVHAGIRGRRLRRISPTPT